MQEKKLERLRKFVDSGQVDRVDLEEAGDVDDLLARLERKIHPRQQEKEESSSGTKRDRREPTD